MVLSIANTNISICTQLNDFKNYYLTLLILFNKYFINYSFIKYI